MVLILLDPRDALEFEVDTSEDAYDAHYDIKCIELMDSQDAHGLLNLN